MSRLPLLIQAAYNGQVNVGYPALRSALVLGQAQASAVNPASDARDVRKGLAQPVVDIDGHLIESMPALSDYLRGEFGPRRLDAYLRLSQ